MEDDMLDFVGTILVTASMVVVVNSVISTLDVSLVAKLALAAIIGLWIGLQVALASAGAFSGAVSREFPLVGLMLATPIVATVAAARTSQKVRTALLALPQPLLIGLNSTRLVGALFLLLAAGGRLSGPFPYSAGWGDILTAVLALPLAFAVARKPMPNATFWWNALGTADLLAAITLGTISAEGTPFQLIHAGVGSEAVGHLPWSLIPTVLVPFYLILHGIVFAQLRATQPQRVTAG
jgi:hypothetical protein